MTDVLPCEWPTSYAGCPGGVMPEPLASLPPSGVETFEQMAKEYLWNWTGRSYGTCSVTIQPCRQDCTEGRSSFWGSGPTVRPGGVGTGPWTPVLIDGLWFNIGCGGCGDKCGCGGSSPLKIPGPIESVESITIDGVELDPANYHVDNRALLVRDDGSWPACDMEINYTRGTAVPVGGQVAAGRLAVELAKAACGDKTCALPQRVQTITRQGVTIAMLDAFDDIDKGHTGIWLIDNWIASVTKPPSRSHVISPDQPRYKARRRTWP